MIDIASLERTELQSRLDNVMLNIIRAHVGKPCPTRRTVMEWTGIPRRKVWAVFDDMARRGLIEVEATCHEPAVRRRMRVKGGRWTDWTARRPAMVPT